MVTEPVMYDLHAYRRFSQEGSLWLFVSASSSLCNITRFEYDRMTGKTTDCYRRLARSQLTPHDHVLEIGSAYGKCTEIIHLHAGGRVIGIDISAESVEASRHEYPALRFEKLDALQVQIVG